MAENDAAEILIFISTKKRQSSKILTTSKEKCSDGAQKKENIPGINRIMDVKGGDKNVTFLNAPANRENFLFRKKYQKF